MKSPKCCKRFMVLKAATYIPLGELDSGDYYLFFQCNKCGKVDKKQYEVFP